MSESKLKDLVGAFYTFVKDRDLFPEFLASLEEWEELPITVTCNKRCPHCGSWMHIEYTVWRCFICGKIEARLPTQSTSRS